MSVYDLSGILLTYSPYIDAVQYGCDNTGAAGASDTIQAYINANKYCYFPAGTYNIDKIVYFPANRVIICEPGAVFKRTGAINGMFTSAGTSDITAYNGVHDILIYGATFDSDGSSASYSCTALSFCHAQRVTIQNCRFINPTEGWHHIEVNSGKDCKIIGCVFDGTGNTSESIQIGSPYNSSSWPFGNGSIDDTPCVYCEVCGCSFYNATTAIGNHGSDVGNYCDIHDCVFDTLSGTAITVSGTNNRVHDCAAVSCTGFASSEITKYNNFINGTFTA